MLSIWWDYKGVVYFKLLLNNWRTINLDVYCQQLVKLEETIKQKRPELTNRKGIVFHHDDARPRVSLATRTKLLELGWEVMSHPPYSPDLAPSDYHFFRSLQNFLNGKNLSNNDDLKSHLIEFFAAKDQEFYQRWIMKLPERWQKVIEQNGHQSICFTLRNRKYFLTNPINNQLIQFIKSANKRLLIKKV